MSNLSTPAFIFIIFFSQPNIVRFYADRAGRRDILRIHTRKMKDGDALGQDAVDFIEDLGDNGKLKNGFILGH